MKTMFRVLGVILILCGVVLRFIASSAQEDLEPKEVKVGYISNGDFVETDSGRMGGNEEGQETMESIKLFGTFAIVGGVVSVIASLAIREDDD